MRKLVAFLACVASLLAAGAARAASVDLAFLQNSGDATQYGVYLYTSLDPGFVNIQQIAFHIVATPAVDFVIDPAATTVDPFTTSFPGGFSAKILTGNDLHIQLVAHSVPDGIATPGMQIKLGTLTNTSGFTLASFIPGNDDGGTILDQDFNKVAPYRVVVADTSMIFPEPEAALLVAFGLAGLSLSASPRRRTS